MEINMPKLGESVHEGTIEQWLVEVGDTIEEYEPICEVITDKVTAEVPSTEAGTITKILVEAGETIKVGTPICEIEGENTQTSAPEKENSEEKKDEEKSSKNETHEHQKSNTNLTSNQPLNNGRFSPVVFKLASEHQIDLSQVQGTGFEGRVTKKDIENVIQNPDMMLEQSNVQDQTSIEVADTPTLNETYAQNNTSSNTDSIPVNGVRKQIAKNMVTSVTEIPHAWMMIEADATNLVNTRNHYKNKFKQDEGYNLTFFAFFVKAAAEALKAFPMLNSSWQGSEIKVHKDINISIAVAVEDKLFTPVIHHADEKSIKGIAREINTLAQKARNNKLTQEDLSGGTFTVNNTGTFGSVSSMGIINYPQAAILQVESIVKKPVVIDDMIAIRNMVNLCISIDHRILDGLQAGRFMNYIKERIEQYSIEHTHIY
ncbi:putative dihydrolipoamide branched chain transacylase (E2) [Staphylococcus piscifermentans]|uniref:Dihydrolipoamide acetyltransferase component of pyruvate dehydrogenase complex n=1 Tax=Staphylococcus piscifermentans TaxID=70258 RepID=A0A239U220_9STAP|nr:dihydrolipoamide acetyltransferase family protein [Staphylococcus piscifermentans]RTX84609.1 2-oxo acid dehydrogenase subunit E2 [Staphylococcus piscifermentans]GEP84762.1 dihydrolipoamide acetyltransferase component of pyruvate dehydrogenase complex [Staphylococcus piscifermentans]SNV04040.1 putative dihydrolipoamide branched chain transacylase (E2) [Staphylococcus piscifermentans]